MTVKTHYKYNRRRIDLRFISNAIASLKLKIIKLKKSWVRTKRHNIVKEPTIAIRNHPLTGQPKTEIDFWVMQNYK